MSAPIGPGDWVECVDASPDRVLASGLVAGTSYQVEAVDVEAGTPDRRGFLLVGVRHPGNPAGAYRPTRFRPIRKPDIEVLKSLLTPAPEVALEDA